MTEAVFPAAAEQTIQGNGHPDSAHLWLPSQDARELLDNELETPEFDLPGLIAPGVLTALGGYTGAGKTPTVADLIRSMLQGNEFCGIPMQRPLPPDYKFLFMTQESEHTFKPTLHRMGLDPVLRTGQMEIVYLHKVLAKAPEATWDDIVDGAYAKFGRPRGLLIVDPLSDWSMVKNEDDNAVMAKAFRPLVGVVGTGLSGFVVVHAWKSFDSIKDEDVSTMHIRGAGAIVSNCSQIWTYKHPMPKVEDPSVRFMRQVRRRLGDQMEDRYVRLDGDGLQRVEDPHSLYGDFKRTKDRVLKAIKDAGADGIRNAELAEASGVERHKLTGVAEGLQSQGLVYPSGVKRSKKDPLRWHPA